MPYIKDGSNNVLFIPTNAGSGDGVNTEAYANNMRCALNEDFTAAKATWTVTNGTLTNNGLSCNGYSLARYNSYASLDYEKSIIRFVYSGDTVIGVFLSANLAWVDTANKTLNFGIGYSQSSTLPTATNTESITFDFVSGREYEISIYRDLSVSGTVKIRDTVEGTEITLSATLGTSRLTNMTGCVVISGETVINKFLYYAPLFAKAKVLIVGDSITYGGAVSDKTKRWGTMLIEEYLHNNGVMCGIGGDGSGNAYQNAMKLLSMGYSFDYVLIATGTNDSPPTSSSKSTYESYISGIESYGCEVIWCIPPRVQSSSSEERVAAVRAVLLSIDGLKTIRFDHATSTNGDYDSRYFADGTHTNEAGNQRQYEFAKSALEMYGIT